MQRLQDLNGGSHTRKLEELEQLKTQSREAQDQFKEHQRDIEPLHENTSQAEKDLELKASPIGKQKSDVAQAENALRNLRDRGQQRDGFHERMPMLLRAIQQDSSFGSPPVGPVGHHVRLLKPKWSSILENTLGSTLGSFIVRSKRDMNILSGIMKRVTWWVLIISPPNT